MHEGSRLKKIATFSLLLWAAFFALGVASLAAYPSSVSAGLSSSTNFTVIGGEANVGGGTASSTNFAVTPGASMASSTSFMIQGSFSFPATPVITVVSSTSSTNGGGGNGGGNNNNGGGNTGGAGVSGGGASGGYTPPTPTVGVSIRGGAYPQSRVTVLQDGQIVAQTIAGPDGNFTVTLSNSYPGSYIFSIYGEDSAGRRSSLYTFPVSLTAGATTNISGVFISPTIDVDKSTVKKGDTLVIFGQALPNAKVTIQVNSNQTLFLAATSSANGAYVYDFDTSPLDLGAHSTKAKVMNASLISNDSVARAFTVGTENIAAQPAHGCPPKGDVNGDCRVNLVDFSILAYWYGRPHPPAKYLLDGSAAVDLRDFSIMAYYWTG